MSDEDWGDTDELESAGEDEATTSESLYYPDVDTFVREHLRFIYSRAVDGRTRFWAADWWRYPEAIARLDALWRAWEALRLDPAMGMSVWFRDHADIHMPVLFSDDGPFAASNHSDPANHCEKGEPLPYEAPPAGLFD